jgi:hypothetical protein
MKITKPTLAFAFIAIVLLAAGSVTYEYKPPKIVYGEPIVKDCRASAVNEVAYSMMDENGHAGCEKHQLVEDKTRLAELKRAYPRRVQ